MDQDEAVKLLEKELGVAKFNKYREENPDEKIDFTAANLAKLNLTDVNFCGLNFYGANLYGAILRNSRLERASFITANLSKANLRYCDARKCTFLNADISGARLEGACFNYADFRRANLSESYLSRASFEGANLRRASLEGANLEDTKIVAFYGARHFAFAHKSEYEGSGVIVKIGCKCSAWENWARDRAYRNIGRLHSYTEQEIRIYGAWIMDVLPVVFPTLEAIKSELL